ncbi:MAG TPA: alpha/beta fold hydrolase [Gemmatimonadaceae bacterium]|nr:alpha/beta fold hydrolase [Gemmatimonadaceae bacterium]
MAASSLAAQTPRAIAVDPPRDSAHPARMEVLHIPSGGVRINGVAYLASGAGTHPTFVLLHGLPGNEKNLDLAQAVRRAGWNAITFNYRGSWGSPGAFRFGQNLEDADAVLRYLAASARQLGIDTTHVVIAGHSMGGWVAILTAAHHPELAGLVLISAADMGADAALPRDTLTAVMADNMEALAGVTARSMANDLAAGAAKSRWTFADAVPGLTHMRMLVITSDDGLAPEGDTLVSRLRARGNTTIATVHEPTDHSYSDKRIALESAVIEWLAKLRAR